MRKLRYYLRLTLAFINRFKIILFIGVILGLFSFVFLSVMLPLIIGGSIERIGMSGRYHVEELPNEVLSLVGDGLTRVDEEGEVLPNIAKSWDFQEEGKVWIFVIKDGLAWHDGSSVVSTDINYNFSDVEVSYPDNKTIIFRLKNQFSPFPVVVSNPAFKKGLIGTGEWKVKKLILKNEYVEEISLVNSEKQKKVFKFYPTEDQAKLAYKLGKVDRIIDLIDPEPFDDWKTSTVKSEVNPNRYVAIFFNNQDSAFSDNKALRQALYYAVDKDALGGSRAYTPISPNSWAYNSKVKDYEYDLEHAKSTLGDLPEETLNSINIKLATIPALLPVAEKVAENWNELGIKTTVQVVLLMPSEYQAFLAIYDIPLDPDQYATWHSTQLTTNISKYSNPRIDKLLEDGRTTMDQIERKKIYFDFQRYLLEDAPAIFLYHPEFYEVTRK